MNKKRTIICCAAGGVLAAGIIAAAVCLWPKKNPVAEGIRYLAEEILAQEAENGEYLYSSILNQIGAGDVRVDFSLNFSGPSALQNITLGLDGSMEREPQQELFQTNIKASVMNMEVAEASVFGEGDKLYLQLPSVWDDNVELSAKDIDGQWNGCVMKSLLEPATGWNLEIEQDVDIELFQTFEVQGFSVRQFLEAHQGDMEALYQELESVEVEKALEKGLITEAQLEELKSYRFENQEGEDVPLTCYLSLLPVERVRSLLQDLPGGEITGAALSDAETEGETDFIRICVYLTEENRILLLCTLPEEGLLEGSDALQFSLELKGEERTVDDISFRVLCQDISVDEQEISELEMTGSIVKEEEEENTYAVELHNALKASETTEEWSFAGTITEQSPDTEAEESGGGKAAKEGRPFLTVEDGELILSENGSPVAKVSGSMEFMIPEGKIRMPKGARYRIAEMNEFDSMLFMAGCAERAAENYGGYLELLGI